MSVKTANGGKFSFLDENGLEAIAPAGSDVYVHLADNGKGQHEVHGKVRLITTTNNVKTIQELGWVRTGFRIESDNPDLYLEGHRAVIESLEALNPNVEFVID